MIHKLTLEKIKPILMTNGDTEEQVSMEVHTYVFGVRVFKHEYSRIIDCPISDEPTNNKSKTVGFKK